MIPLLTALFYAAYTDFKSRKIPIWLFPATLILCTASYIYSGDSLVGHILGGLVMLVATFIGCLLGKLGGADLIMLTVVGYGLGVYWLPIFSFLMICIGILFLLITKKKEYAIAPIVLLSYLIWYYLSL